MSGVSVLTTCFWEKIVYPWFCSDLRNFAKLNILCFPLYSYFSTLFIISTHPALEKNIFFGPLYIQPNCQDIKVLSVVSKKLRIYNLPGKSTYDKRSMQGKYVWYECKAHAPTVLHHYNGPQDGMQTSLGGRPCKIPTQYFNQRIPNVIDNSKVLCKLFDLPCIIGTCCTFRS